MGLKKDLLLGIVNAGYEFPSPIQEESIPPILAGKNVIGRAKNGTGKTMSYGIPILEKVDPSSDYLQGLIIVNARELALQVSKNLKDVGQYLNLKIMSIMGGESVKDDINRLSQHPHILIGTPGRLNQFILDGHVNIENLKIIALDEADQVIQLNEDILINIFRRLPKTTQRVMFSASFPAVIKSFCDQYIPNTININTMEQLTLIGVTQYYIFLEEKNKLACLKYLFSSLSINQCMIFCRTTYRAMSLSRALNNSGLSCFVSHNDLSQQDRNKIFDGFRKDFLSRGIDVQNVNVVVNFDLANSSVKHLHRVGRSGRFGHLGLAISLVTERDKETFFRIERELNINIEKMPDRVDPALYH